MRNWDGTAEEIEKWPCWICKEGVGRNSIKCTKFHKWIHKRCSKIKGKLKEDAQFQCALCVLGPDAHSSVKDVGSVGTVLGQDCELEQVDRFCYLGDMLGSGEGAEEASRTRVRCAWAKFNELGPILTCRGATWKLKGKIECVYRVFWYMVVNRGRRRRRRYGG